MGKIAYPVPLKQEAKRRDAGMATVSVVLPDGTRFEEQGVLTLEQCMFFKWAMALVFCDQVRELPDLEATIRQLMEKKP